MKQISELNDHDLLSRIYKLTGEYISAYSAEHQRLDRNEYLYTGRHWEDDADDGDTDEPKPVTPVIFSTVENLKADMMDSFPEAIIQPETPEDDEVAKVTGALIDQNHDAANYRAEYLKLAHDLLNSGTMVHEVGYDPFANNGVGSAFIRYADVRNIMFDPQAVADIQRGRAVIKLESRTIESLDEEYPDMKGRFSRDDWSLGEDKEITFDKDKSLLQIEFWWRELRDGQYHVHMAKAAGRQLLDDSRRQKPQGYYSHGKYPFIITPFVRRKNSVLGYGIADLFGRTEEIADKIDQIVIENAYMAKSAHMFVQRGAGFNLADLQDWRKRVHECDRIDGVKWFTVDQLPQSAYQMPAAMRAMLKDESGANDFSRGSTNSGVTAASAIAALQETASKRSRMASDQMHAAFKEAVRMEIEVEREFNILPRQVLVTIDNERVQKTFESAMLNRVSETGVELPIEFYISIKVQKENRWQIISHNEEVLQMVQLGIIPPQSALKLMVIEGKDQIMAEALEYAAQQQAQAQAQAQAAQQQAGAESGAGETIEEIQPPEMALNI